MSVKICVEELLVPGLHVSLVSHLEQMSVFDSALDIGCCSPFSHGFVGLEDLWDVCFAIL